MDPNQKRIKYEPFTQAYLAKKRALGFKFLMKMGGNLLERNFWLDQNKRRLLVIGPYSKTPPATCKKDIHKWVKYINHGYMEGSLDMLKQLCATLKQRQRQLSILQNI